MQGSKRSFIVDALLARRMVPEKQEGAENFSRPRNRSGADSVKLILAVCAVMNSRDFAIRHLLISITNELGFTCTVAQCNISCALLGVAFGSAIDTTRRQLRQRHEYKWSTVQLGRHICKVGKVGVTS